LAQEEKAGHCCQLHKYYKTKSKYCTHPVWRQYQIMADAISNTGLGEGGADQSADRELCSYWLKIMLLILYGIFNMHQLVQLSRLSFYFVHLL
jgi:hypothetical protein